MFSNTLTKLLPPSLNTALYATLRQASTLILAEHKGKLSNATLNAISAAHALNQDIAALVAGKDVTEVANAISRVEGVSQVLVADDARLADQLPEMLAPFIAALQRSRQFSHVFAPATSFGKDLLPRAAALLGAQPASDIIRIVDADTVVRPIYAGNALLTLSFSGPGVRMATIRPSSVAPAPLRDAAQPAAPIEVLSDFSSLPPEDQINVTVIDEDFSGSTGKAELGSAKVVVCGGRGLRSAEGFKMLDKLADVLGGAVGASRAAVDAGWVGNDLQVGQTGKVVSPSLYIGVGISGAIQHLAGMKDSKVIVAINSDASAPIFQVADYGLAQDLFTAIPELEARLRKMKSEA